MSNTFIQVNYPEPHIGRTKKIMAAHPEIKKLFGNTPSTLIWISLCVGAQIALAAVLTQAPWWAILLAAYIVGATLNHALLVMIHECTHNLVLKGSNANRWVGIFANLPIVFPCAIGFRNYHLIHHRRQGELEYDADLAGPKEARIFSRSPVHKMVWMLFFVLIEGIVRPMRVKKVNLLEPWGLVNVAVELAFLAAVVVLAGWGAFAFLALSSLFSVGLHPLGARWIQEHYVVRDGQETYSYYGALNKIMFNVGYHNEHHDLMVVPWSRLPQVKAIAPEFYDNLYSHPSYVKLMFRFFFDPSLNLFSRAIRTSKEFSQKPVPETESSSETLNVSEAIGTAPGELTPAL
jgi:sphingolipid delta-4 desaturase